jgi:chromodomain-helicase-DNA-binding protein 4
MAKTRKTHKRTLVDASFKVQGEVSMEDSDDSFRDAVPKKKARKARRRPSSISEADNDNDISTGDLFEEGSSNDSKLGPNGRNRRPKRVQRETGFMGQKTYTHTHTAQNFQLSPSDESDESDYEYDLLYSGVSTNGNRKYRRDPAPIDAQAKLIPRAGSRRSQRVRRIRIPNMKDVDLEEPLTPSSDSISSSPTPKAIGAKEVFKEFPQGNLFCERHSQVCETCGNTKNEAGILVYCQGCSLSYHKNCLGNRSTRDHLVTKIAEENFVLQCRRCINFHHRRETTGPDQSMCQVCKKVGPSCLSFRSRKTTTQEHREREENNGVDPIADVNPSLINNPSNVLLRCTKCKRSFHYDHLLPLNHLSSNTSSGHSQEARNVQYIEYTQNWQCNDCQRADDKTVASIAAWRPINVETYIPGTVVESIGQDDIEYLVKWENFSYFQVTWMPGAWVWGAVANGTRSAFTKKNPHMSLSTEVAIPEAFLRIDIVLDVHYWNNTNSHTAEADRARIRDVDKAFVKYKGLGYEDAAWEYVPTPDNGERWTDFVTAYNDWVLSRYIQLPNPTALKLRLEQARDQNFTKLEKTKQPEIMTGGKLMKYQLDGLNWMYHQWHNKHNGILADEMGLGKTIQVISFLATMVQDHHCFPFLIVVPNSTCPNWRREIKQWAPSLRVVAYYGSSAARKIAYNYELYPGTAKVRKDLRCHIVVTSYEAATDASSSQFFKGVPWEGLIVDEGQRLKNDKSILHNTLASWKIPFRLLLSGTPLQNNARELFNLLQFLDDGVNANTMQNEFSELKKEKILKLHGLIRSYILRRTKAQVLNFLPPMAQIILPVSMSVLQKKLYKSIIAKNPALLRALFNSSSLKVQERANLNNILMQLRKCLCHPFIYSRYIEEQGLEVTALHRNLVEASSKLQLLEVLLPKLKDCGHRVLIFSQFLIC